MSYLQKHPVTVFTYDYKSDGRQHGHAIVTDGCSYDSTTDSYTVKLYDENSYGGGNSLPALIDMTISGDCTAFSFTDANENPISNSSYISMNYLDLDRIASSGRTSGEKSSGDMILIPAHGSCTLTGSSGKTLICRDGVLSGTMSVLDARDIVRSQTDADASQILVRVPSETSYTVKSGTAELDVTISSDTGLTSVTGTGLSAASVTPGKELTMQGNSYEFRAVQTTPDLISTNENEMIGLSGTASSSVTLTSSAARAKTLEIRTSGTISGASAESYEGSKTQAIPTAPALRSGSTLTAGGSASAGTAFADVPADAYYKDAVDWAVANGVTVGTGANTFSPNSVCTRAQSVTFLWRASGSPAPGSSAMPFSDVPAGSYYYKAVQWAVEHGIVKGTSAKTFSPNASCSRAQIVTMLWRFGGSETADAAARFADVPASAYFAGAVQWAVANQITNGAGANTFRPSGSCTRAQIVTFLYRYQNK